MNLAHITKTNITQIGDPFVIRVGDEYYLYSTCFQDGANIQGFDCRSSRDLVHWSDPMPAYRVSKRSFGYTDFWAPEVVYHDGKYLMHYSARRRSDDTLLVGVAVSQSPRGPFLDVNEGPMFDFGYAAIDAHVLCDESGSYLFYSRDCSQHVVEGRHESHILAVRLDDTLTRVVGDPVPVLKPDCAWETCTGDFRWTEGPFVAKRGGLYYLMYSSGFYAARTYSCGYAVAEKPLGPYVKAKNNPFLYSEGELSGPGHNCVVTGKDGIDYCVFHVHSYPDRPSQDRRMCFCPVAFGDGVIRQL